MSKKLLLFVLSIALLRSGLRAADPDPTAATDGYKSLSRIVVVEHRTEEGAARLEQEHAANIVNVMTAKDILRLPDVNAAEALRRVPGISLWSDTGEGRFVAIRGLDADLNSTTFNGIRLLPTNPASIFGGGRAVALDVVEDLDEGLLGEVFGGLTIADHAVDQREHRALVATDQLPIRLVTAFLREGDQICVREVGSVE